MSGVPMIREGSIQWNAAAEIIPAGRETGQKEERTRERERKIHDDARAAKKERRREKIQAGKKEARDRWRRSRRVIGQTSRYFRTSLDRPDGRTNAPGKRRWRRKRRVQ